MKISAIIPTYNSEKTLEDAILSVSNSAYPLLEIIIIDDGSNTQDAKFIVESLNKKINISIIYIRQDNLGPSSARNRGINIARGDWIAFLDSDDLMLVDCIQSKLDHFYCCNDKPNIGAIYGSFIWSSTNQTQMFQKSYLPVSRNHVGIMGKVPGGAPAYIFKKDALLNINGFALPAWSPLHPLKIYPGTATATKEIESPLRNLVGAVTVPPHGVSFVTIKVLQGLPNSNQTKLEKS